MNHVMLNAYIYFVFAVTYLLLTGGSDPRHASPCFLLHLSPPLLVRWPLWIGASGPRLQNRLASAQPATLQTLDQSQEGPLPRVPRQQSVDQPVSYTHLRAHETRHDIVCRL